MLRPVSTFSTEKDKHGDVRKMFINNSFIKELFVFIYFFETLCTQVGLSEKQKQGFVRVHDKDFEFFDDGQTISISQSFSEDQTFSYQDEEGTITVLGSPIKFDPPNINFKEQHIGVPGLRKVRVFNINSHSSIQMLSISGNTIHFHCSFFSDKVIPPGGNATFDVVFLGRETGLVENTLYIHTSAGSFRYNVEGEATPNPYRIRPLLGVKMPVNSSYSPVIQIHNPHPTTIQVLEVYSSGGDLHLELPSGEPEENKQAWEILPYHTKVVMKANFAARTESNTTAYIRIRTNSTGAEYLYLPLEIEVTSTPGIYCPQESLNFAHLPSEGGSVSLDVSLINSGSRPVSISSIVSNPVSEALTIELQNTKVASSTIKPTVVARVTFDSSLAASEGFQSGKLIIKSKNSQHRVILPWMVNVLKGNLHWNQTISKFLVTDSPDPEDPSQAPYLSTTRPLIVTNKFSVPLVVHSIFAPPEAEKAFKIGNLNPTVMQPGETVKLVNLSVRKKSVLLDSPKGRAEGEQEININTFIILYTNITNVRIPLMAFDGKLKPFFPSSPTEKVLDFGTIGMNEKRDMYFTLVNKGPVKVVLRGWGGNITGSLIELMGVDSGNETDILSRNNLTSLPRKLYVLPGHYVVYRIGLLTNNVEGEVWASVFVSTEFQDLHVPFRFRVAKGSLSTLPDQLTFGSAFPGRKSELSFYVYSSFKHEMTVKSLSVVGGDPRFSFQVVEGSPISPGEKSLVGKVVFNPSVGCQELEDCYAGFNHTSKFGHPWYLGLALPLNLWEMDLSIVHTLWSRMRAAALTNASKFNVTLSLDTSEVRGFHFSARAALSWPILCLDPVLKFPLTQIGNSSVDEILLFNPSEETILVHIVPMSSYPNVMNILPHTPNRIEVGIDELSIPDPEDSTTFQILSVTDADEPHTALEKFGEDFLEKFGIGVAPNTYPIVLEPGQGAKITVMFTPKDTSKVHSSVLFIRNNLTGVETIDVYGRGAIGDFKFGNRRAGSTIHAFDVTEKHLKDCDKEPVSHTNSLPNLTVKRPFTARNTGEVPLWVTGFEIDGYPCEGYGFKVLDCDPFELAANDSKRINIAFTPDFTLARITRTLTMKTSLSSIPGKGDVKYQLAATVPAHLLAICAKSLPRPKWEGYLYGLLVTLMVLSLLCILVAALVESDRILRYCYIISTHTANQVPENAKLLDLRQVARLTLQECAERERSVSPNQMISTPRNSKKVECSTPDLKNTQPLSPELSRFSGFLSIITQSFPSINRAFFTQQSATDSVAVSSEDTDDKELDTSKTNTPISKKKKSAQIQPDAGVTSTSKKNKKAKVIEVVKPRPKISPQSSVIDDLDTSSTTTESSNPEELTEPIPKVAPNINSETPSVQESGKKKKAKKNKIEDQQTVKETKPSITKPKKVVEKRDSKIDKQDKLKISPKPSRETSVKPVSPPPTTPPVVKKQEAKVKGVPKEGGDLRRQQSLPTYDKPPRLQQPRHESPSGFPQSQTQPLEGFPTITLPKADPPRAIIYPEVKRENPVNQFGAIGCKVPVSSTLSWNDQGPSQLGLSPVQSLMNPPTARGLSMMQELQAERRKREEAFRRSQWPGFGPEPQVPGARRDYLESLWDPPANPNPHGMWGTLGQNVWPSTVLQNPSCAQGKPEEVDHERFGLDPLTLSSIWNAANKKERDQNTWSSTLFNNNKDL